MPTSILSRRGFTTLAAAAAFVPPTRAADASQPFYARTGPELTLYDLDVHAATLTPRTTTTLPANLQYAWPHPSRKFLYVIASNGQPPTGPAGAAGGDKNHYALAFRVAADGSLTPHGPPQLLPVRPLHVSLDRQARHLLIAYNSPSMITVHRIRDDGSIGDPVAQDASLDFGIYAHQVRATPSGRSVTLCSRGNDAAATRPEDPGHIEVFAFDDGKLSNRQSLAPHGQGLGFGPRHLDFSPDGRFAFVSLERENSLCVYGMTPDGMLSAEPLFIKNALADPQGKAGHPGQTCGPDPRPPQWRIRLSNQSRLGHPHGCRRPQSVEWRGEQRGGLGDQSWHRRTHPHPECAGAWL